MVIIRRIINPRQLHSKSESFYEIRHHTLYHNLEVLMVYRVLTVVFIVALQFAALGCKSKVARNENVNNNLLSSESFMGESSLKKAPNFKLETIAGKTLPLSDYKNKIVIVDFWATWCPPCRRGIPDLIALQNEFKKNLVIIGISVDRDTRGSVADFARKQGINYPICYFTDKVVDDFGGIEGIPTSFIIDKKGNIVDSHVGLVDKDTYVQTIKRLLKK
jgi:thiol-disulfide isomerase/thioredoxin